MLDTYPQPRPAADSGEFDRSCLRLNVNRIEPSAAVEQQRVVVEHLLRSNVDQLRHYENLKATIERNSSRIIEDVGDLVRESSTLPTISDEATVPTGAPRGQETDGQPSPRVAEPAIQKIKSYCDLINSLLGEVEMADVLIGDDTRARIRGDVIETQARDEALEGNVWLH